MNMKTRTKLWAIDYRLKRVRRDREENEKIMHAAISMYFDSMTQQRTLTEEEVALTRIRAELQNERFIAESRP